MHEQTRVADHQDGQMRSRLEPRQDFVTGVALQPPRLLSRFTERLIQVAAAIVLCWFGWQLAQTTVIGYLQAVQAANQAQQKLAACEASKAAPAEKK